MYSVLRAAALTFLSVSFLFFSPAARSTGNRWQDLELLAPEVLAPGVPVDWPVEEIRIAGVPDKKRVRVELDGDQVVDATVKGGELVVTPVRLPWRRSHRVRLFEVLAAGPHKVGWIEERGRWIFVTKQPGSVVEAELHATATAAAGWRITGDEGGGNDGSLEAVARVRARVAGTRWRLGARVDLTHAEPSADGGLGVDLGTFLVEGAAGPLAVAAGDQNFGRGLGGLDGLTFGSFYRRGVSARLGLGSSGLGLAAFVAAVEPTAAWGTHDAAGEPRERVTGAILSRQPTASGSRLALAAVYLTGEGSPDGGDGVAGDPSPAAGELWGIAAEGRLFDRRLSLHGEVAESRVDIDGTGGAAEPRRDEAFALGAAFGAREHDAFDDSLDWRVGAERRQVGTFFRSLGNPALGTDQDAREGFVWLSWRRRLDLELRLRRDRDNVAGLDLLPRAEADSASLAATYRRPAGAAAGGWLTPRTVSLFAYRSEEENLRAPDPSFGLDRSIRAFHLAAAGAAWNLGYSRDRYLDFVRFGVRSSSEIAEARVRFARRRWSLEPAAQWSRFEGSGSAETTLLRLNAYRELIHDALTCSIGADLLRRSAAGEDDRRTAALGADLTWRVAVASGHRPGLALWLRGHYTDDDDDGAVAAPIRATASQLFLGARLSWSRSW